jgi:hypothetical protein
MKTYPRHAASIFAILATAPCLQAQTVSATRLEAVAGANPAQQPIPTRSLEELRLLYRRLITVENQHDAAAVSALVWQNPSALLVAKTATPAGGNWAGFWGADIVVRHIQDLFRAGSFHIDPDYSREKVVGLTSEVAETYAPVLITVAYAGQKPVPKPFLMIIEWIRTPSGWRMATDIALPIPPPPASPS